MLNKYEVKVDQSITDNSVTVENPEQINVEIRADEYTFFVTCKKGSELYKSLMGENPCNVIKKECNNYGSGIPCREWRTWEEVTKMPVQIISINY